MKNLLLVFIGGAIVGGLLVYGYQYFMGQPQEEDDELPPVFFFSHMVHELGERLKQAGNASELDEEHLQEFLELFTLCCVSLISVLEDICVFEEDIEEGADRNEVLVWGFLESLVDDGTLSDTQRDLFIKTLLYTQAEGEDVAEYDFTSEKTKEILNNLPELYEILVIIDDVINTPLELEEGEE